eukprot:7885159-Pyramimonas_sp.AAC.1
MCGRTSIACSTTATPSWAVRRSLSRGAPGGVALRPAARCPRGHRLVVHAAKGFGSSNSSNRK